MLKHNHKAHKKNVTPTTPKCTITKLAKKSKQLSPFTDPSTDPLLLIHQQANSITTAPHRKKLKQSFKRLGMHPLAQLQTIPQPSTAAFGTTAETSVAPAQKTLLQRLKLSSASCITLSPEEHASFNRWKIVPPALLTHLSLGSIFAWSMFNAPLLLTHGVIEPTSSDWSLTQVMPIFSTTMATFGTVSFLSGRSGINEKFGPRVTTLLGATLFAGGFGLSSIAASIHSLPLLYAAYGLMCGSAVGTAYVGPVAALMKWFPDKKGLASSLGIMGFGGGGIFAGIFIERFLNLFRKLPKRIGDTHAFPTQLIDGKLMATIDGVQQEVVIASAASIKKLGKYGEHLQEGMYLVGTGDIGISNTFLALGALYTILIGTSAMFFRLPHERYDPTKPGNISPLEVEEVVPAKVKKQHKVGETLATEDLADATKAIKIKTEGDSADVAPSPAVVETDKMTHPLAKASNAVATQDGLKKVAPQFSYVATDGSLKPVNVIKTKQFWLLWAALIGQSGAAYSIIGSAKTLMVDIYSLSFPMIVTSSFAAVFVSMISAFNLSGRLGWGVVSDKIGRKKTFSLLFGLGVPFYLMIPLSSHLLETGGQPQSSMLPLVLFYSSVCLAISVFGGGAALSPAYISDLFGPKYAAANAGQLLSYLVISGYLGPVTCSQLRELATKQAIEDLVTKVDMSTFFEKFGALPSDLPQLIANKTVTIAKMMEICPPGTIDPTPYLYDTVFITMAALQMIAFGLNQGINKVDPAVFKAQDAADAAEAEKMKKIQAMAATLDKDIDLPKIQVINDWNENKETIPVDITPEQQKQMAEFDSMVKKDNINDKAKPMEFDTEGLKEDLIKAEAQAEEFRQKQKQ